MLKSTTGFGILVHFPGYDRLCGHRRGKQAACGIFCYLHDDLVCLPPSRLCNVLRNSRGTSAPSVLLDVWYNNNIAHEGRRVVLTSIGVPLANLMGVVSSNIFQNKDGTILFSCLRLLVPQHLSLPCPLLLPLSHPPIVQSFSSPSFIPLSPSPH